MIDLKPDAFHGDPIGRGANQSGHAFLVGMAPAWLACDLGAPIAVFAAIYLALYGAFEVYQVTRMGGEALDCAMDFAFVSAGLALAYQIQPYVPNAANALYYGTTGAILAYSAAAWRK